jgi:hypothetical protein
VPGLRVFLSHASADLDTAVRVHGWLTAAGHEVFLDRHRRDGVRVGDAWEARLHEELRGADAVVCIVTAAYRTSTWCTAEVAVARSRGSLLLPMRAEPDVTHPLLTALQYADLATDPTGAREHLLATLRRLVATGGRGWLDERSPFPGLRAFEPEDRLAFFGRDRDVERLAEALRSTGGRAARSALVVVGPSGCGKSSTVRAGLVPMMAAEGGWVVLPPLVPGVDPVEALVMAMVVAARQAGVHWTAEDLRTTIDGEGLTHRAHDLLLAGAGPPGRHLLVVVDQFEELLTLTPAAQRERFAALLTPALAGPVRLVATLRPEFLGPVLADPVLAQLNPSIEPLVPLGRDALRLVVEGPARLWGITVPDELVARLVDDTGAGEALPLLAFTLARLTEHAARGDTIPLAAYEDLGGVAGALTSQADAACADATAATGATRDEILAVLLMLVTVDAQGRPTGRPRQLDGTAAAVAGAFVERRLLVTATDGDGRVTTGVAHETFLSTWPPLREAIAQAATALRARGGVEEAARDWDGRDRPTDRLWEKGRLAAAFADVGARVVPAPRPAASPTAPARPAWLPRRSRVLVADRVALDPLSREFLHASLRRDRFLRSRLVAVLTALLVATGSLAAVAVSRGARLDRELTVATAQLLASAATARAVDDPAFATKLALAAWHADPGGPAARDALADQYVAMQSVQRVQQNLPIPPVLGFGVMDREGRTAVAVHDDGATVVTDLLGPAPATWRVPGVPVEARFTVGGDGRWLAALGEDGLPVVWDVPGRAGPYAVDTGGSTLASPPVLGFARDGRVLLGAVTGPGGRSAVAAWDVTTRARVPVSAALVEQQPIVGLWGTSDPDLVVVRTTTGGPDGADRIVTRSLRDGSVRHVLSERRAGDPAAEVVRSGRGVATCLEGPEVGRYAVVVTATDTGAETARVPLRRVCGGELPLVTGDRNHLAEAIGPVDSPYQVIRVVDLGTGAAVEAVVPRGRFDNPTRADPTMTVLTPPSGPPAVLVRRATSLLALGTTPDPLDPVSDAGQAYASADGRDVVVDRPESVLVRDVVSGEEQGRLGPLRGGDGDLVVVGVEDEVQMVTRAAGRWTISTYSLPALTGRESYPVPVPADADPGSTTVNAVSDGDRMVAVADGLLTVWDRNTRQQVGGSVTVGEGPEEQRAFRDAMVKLRPGRPDQVVIAAPGRPVVIYSLADRRILARLPVPSATNAMVVDDSGRRLAVRTTERTVELWDIDSGRRATGPLFAPDASTLVGFSGDGYLVTANRTTDALQWWDVDRGALSGTVRLGGRLADPRDRADPLFLSTFDGMPGQLPLAAQVWADRLCAVVGPYTEAELRALPVGAQDRRPCP